MRHPRCVMNLRKADGSFAGKTMQNFEIPTVLNGYDNMTWQIKERK